MPELSFTLAARDVATDVEPLVININGNKYTCKTSLPEFALLDFAAKATGLTNANDPAQVVSAMTAAFNFITDVFVPEDSARFLADAKEGNWSVEAIMPMLQSIIEAMTANPIGPPSESQPGQ